MQGRGGDGALWWWFSTVLPTTYTYAGGSPQSAAPALRMCWSWLVLALESWLHTSRPTFAFSDVFLVDWNWPWWECLHHKISKHYKSELSSPYPLLLNFYLQHTTGSSACGQASKEQNLATQSESKWADLAFGRLQFISLHCPCTNQFCTSYFSPLNFSFFMCCVILGILITTRPFWILVSSFIKYGWWYLCFEDSMRWCT